VSAPASSARLYGVRPEGLAALRDFLTEFWPEQLQQLKQAVESGDEGTEAADAG
jgi:hypothetical protein